MFCFVWGLWVVVLLLLLLLFVVGFCFCFVLFGGFGCCVVVVVVVVVVRCFRGVLVWGLFVCIIGLRTGLPNGTLMSLGQVKRQTPRTY